MTRILLKSRCSRKRALLVREGFAQFGAAGDLERVGIGNRWAFTFRQNGKVKHTTAWLIMLVPDKASYRLTLPATLLKPTKQTAPRHWTRHSR